MVLCCQELKLFGSGWILLLSALRLLAMCQCVWETLTCGNPRCTVVQQYLLFWDTAKIHTTVYPSSKCTTQRNCSTLRYSVQAALSAYPCVESFVKNIGLDKFQEVQMNRDQMPVGVALKDTWNMSTRWPAQPSVRPSVYRILWPRCQA